MKNGKTLEDLWGVMMDTIEGVREGSLTLEQAKTMSEVGQTAINIAKVQVSYIKARSGEGTSTLLGVKDEEDTEVIGPANETRNFNVKDLGNGTRQYRLK